MSRTLPTEPVAAPPDCSALLSALVDGESDADDAGRGCRLWREDGEARATWHTYQLIGDVLRSEELAAEPARDQAFLKALRARLADEPVVLAPAATANAGRERRWITGAAVAAGFAALAGVVVVARMQQADPVSGPALAAAPAAVDVQRVSTLPASASAPAPTLVIDGHVIRDARLDAYFEAHRGAVMALPSAVPGGGLRNVDVMLPQR